MGTHPSATQNLDSQQFRSDTATPECGQEFAGLRRAQYLHRIAANLIRSAAEALAQASTANPQIRVSLTSRAIEFRDNGPGLPEKARANLFRPFAGSSRANGTGLGLVIAHELAEAAQAAT